MNTREDDIFGGDFRAFLCSTGAVTLKVGELDDFIALIVVSRITT